VYAKLEATTKEAKKKIHLVSYLNCTSTLKMKASFPAKFLLPFNGLHFVMLHKIIKEGNFGSKYAKAPANKISRRTRRTIIFT
jgi:hypothetical protein